ncbi:unnamed protein product [Durusdinium trenchii]|uniref:Uncharacterized protein n=2 Tax=Durusdinium trenchii TaxID=1381693 RepID=A0ABP0K7P2_9DINO
MRHYFVLFLVLGFGIFVGSFLPQIVSATQLRARLSRLDHDEHHEQKFLIAKTSQSTSTLPSENSGEMSKDGTEGSKGKQEKLAGLVRQGGDLVDRPTQLFVDGDFLKRDRRKPFMELPPEAECDPLAHVNVLISEGSEGQQGRDRTTREIEKAGFKASVRFWPSQKPEFNQGLSKELVQALGHRKIYETILLEKWACATIFEDNVTLADDFVSRVTAITVTESIPPFDVILWGWCPGKESSNLGDKSGKPQLPQLTYGQPGPCLFAYTVSLQGALLLSQANTPIKFKADEALNGAVWDPTVRPRVDKSRNRLGGSYWHVVPMMAFQR